MSGPWEALCGVGDLPGPSPLGHRASGVGVLSAMAVGTDRCPPCHEQRCHMRPIAAPQNLAAPGHLPSLLPPQHCPQGGRSHMTCSSRSESLHDERCGPEPSPLRSWRSLGHSLLRFLTNIWENTPLLATSQPHVTTYPGDCDRTCLSLDSVTLPTHRRERPRGSRV